MATSERKGGERRFGWLGSGGPPRLASLIESHVVSRFKFPARKAAAEKKGVKEIGEGGRKEPKSGMSFPGSVCLVGDRGSCVDLTGVGVRKKRLAGIAGITAYAVGIYFNNKDIARQSKGEGTPQQLLKSVVSQPAKTSCIRLVVVFPRATPKAIAKSLDDQIGDDLRRQGHYSDFEAFTQAFDGEKFKKGTVITFSTSRNGTMTTFIDGRRKNAVRSQALNSSLMKLYLGENTITKDVREDTLSSLARFI